MGTPSCLPVASHLPVCVCQRHLSGTTASVVPVPLVSCRVGKRLLSCSVVSHVPGVVCLPCPVPCNGIPWVPTASAWILCTAPMKFLCASWSPGSNGHRTGPLSCDR